MLSTLHPVAFLIDTSVWGRKSQVAVRSALTRLADRDEIWTCRAVDLEVVYGEHSSNVRRAGIARTLIRDVPITPQIMDRSLNIAIEMADAGLHRHTKPMDLIIAAAAGSADLTVLHYDSDFDHIASVTGQPVEWVAPPGTLD